MDFNYVIKKINEINVLNRDNGRVFTNTNRLDVIGELLKDSSYRRIDEKGLVQIYGKQDISKLSDAIVISSHIDCEKHISKCFTEELDSNFLLGTFDNSITNAILVSLMLEDVFPDNVIVAFTGDEEENFNGVHDVVAFFKKRHIDFKTIILDVTDRGFKEKCAFTLENNFWTEETCKLVVDSVRSLRNRWRFVPIEVDKIPAIIPKSKIIYECAEADESWEYDEYGIDCFSLCIPVYGEMHNDLGVLLRKKSIIPYANALKIITNKLAKK